MRSWRAENPTHKAHMGRLKGLGEMDADELRSVMGTDRKIGVVHIEDPANLARLAERLFGPKSELRKAWYLERSGESLTVGGAN
jgi:DNA gyrase subunit B